ncbi:hypothetical protein [Aurantiacibacter sediminis]|uniref:Lipoprotein n=1 Tax=Aurantiacibacter sediminis TaxID=2793064 RepID=A0ABS0N500_9SPHN|nr:hypothetical protein [Aurantiacibacter sediminis]MBH5322876.1 hypothetical protein [Aurantiacibacter sediminis]
MRKGFLALTIVLAGCNEAATDEAQPLMGEGSADAAIEAVPEIPEGSYVNASAFIEELRSGSQWCVNYEASSGTCTSVASLNRITEDGVVQDWISGFNGGKTTSRQRLFLEDGRLCIRKSEDTYASTIDVYDSDDNLASLSANDRSIRYFPDGSVNPGFANLRSDIEEVVEGGPAETCWEYYRANSPALGLDTEILMRVYMDGIEQPDDFANSRGAFFGPDTQLRLRPSS